MSSEVNGVNVSVDNVFICIKITYWVRVRRPRQATAPTYSKNAAPLDQPPLPRKNPRSAQCSTFRPYARPDSRTADTDVIKSVVCFGCL